MTYELIETEHLDHLTLWKQMTDFNGIVSYI